MRLTTSERALLAPIFCCTKNQSPASLLLLFRKKARSAHLFGCKRPHNGSLSLPTFCELRELHSISQNRENLFSASEQAAYRLRRLFCKSRRRAHSAAPPFRKRSRRAFAARLQARSQRAGLLPAFFGLRLRLFFPRGPRVTAVRSFAASLCAASVP